MIACFPSPYPDELIYSTFARYYARSGYLAYTFAAQDLYLNKTTKPNIEFINALSPDALESLSKILPIETVIEKHTMFSYYSRFLPMERRTAAFNAITKAENNYNNLLCVPKSKQHIERYLRYCPMCAAADREQYGEAYWHGKHQMIGIDICPLHHCYLESSNIQISSKPSPALITAEEMIPIDDDCSFCDNPLLCAISEYVYSIFASDMDFENNVSIGDYLHSKMEGSKYLSLRGQQRNMTLLHNDYCKYYKPLAQATIEQWQLQKIFTNQCYRTYDICLLALFLNVSAPELVKMQLPEKAQTQIFDEQIKKMHKQGLNYAEIARRLNASYDVVKAIGEGRYGTYHYCKEKPQKGGARRLNWEEIDNHYSPLVTDAVKRLYFSDGRPQKISIGKIEKILNIPPKRLLNCPKSKAEIEKYMESQEEYWVREIIWAVDLLKAQNRPLNYTNIERVTNIRKADLKRCLPYLKKPEYGNIYSLISKL